ncbi:MAG TPA: amidase [Candidatus Acidoferrales bacterium]|nr:amidase [Candidatus Acidoferrales bacterium]
MPNKTIRDLLSLEISRVAPLIRAREVSPVELLEAALDRIDALNPSLNAFITVAAVEALDAARKAEHEILRRRHRGPLHGIPIPLKDNIETKNLCTTAGSRILANYIPAQDADVARALRRAGAIIIGKTNLHEFAYGITSENPHYSTARNPWDATRVAGGSSGGSAIAVATGMGFASVGTDTGGSIRIPSSLCGIVGLKPTFGRVSCRGVIPLSPSLDHVGPLTRSAADAALMLEVISDPRRAFRSPFGTRNHRAVHVKKMIVGLPRDFFFTRADEEIRLAVLSAIKLLEKSGMRIEEIELPRVAELGDAGTPIALAEARRYHESRGFYPARAEEYGEDVRKRLEQGASVSAIEYLQALETREHAALGFDATFGRAEVIVAPATPIAAPKIGETTVRIRGVDETVRSALVQISRPANVSGNPAISIPCGWTKNGLPIGLQLIGKHWDEARLLQIAEAASQELAPRVAAGIKVKELAAKRSAD